MTSARTFWNAKRAKAATRAVLWVLAGLCVQSVVTVTAAAPPVRTMYNDALAREQKVRSVLDAPDAPPATLRDVRAVVSDYEAALRAVRASVCARAAV